ncbi:MAG: UDP-N-acetylmuramate--L-alanine ligase [Alphaproteobacteria bacterium]|nr:UDP-N-acetylmuramate--L-alanine ligase [Alphaproteobacteria bacterium]
MTRRTLPLSHTLPLSIGPLHFIGIGGIGMSGIAEVLHNLGYQVQGSDMAESPNIDRLRKRGIQVWIGHQETQVEQAAVAVASSAVKEDNPELKRARALRIPVVKRAEMLAELMRLKMSVAVAGTHGKTTTTALTAALFEEAGLNPTVINGGIINARGTNAYLGSGEWMVVEADESDGTFTRLPATVAIVTNIDPEHLDHYGSFDGVKSAFHTFLANLPFYGFAVCCIDHPEVQSLIARTTDRRTVTYGFSPQAEVRGIDIRQEKDGQRFDVAFAGGEVWRDVLLSMHGVHNVQNALASIAVARELEISDQVILRALARFQGVKRRFTLTGTARGLSIIDDYGHHPVEIAATLKAARLAQTHTGGRVIAVVQPHRYTRLRDLFDAFCHCFNDADAVVVAEVYAAGEEPIAGVNADALAEGLRRAGHMNVIRLGREQELPQTLVEIGADGDMVVCLGAGSISKWAYALPGQLDALGNAESGMRSSG